MRRTRRTLFLVLLLFLAPAGAMAFAEENPILSKRELFPVSPAVNDQRGFAIAVDGEWMAIGARLEDRDGLSNAGAVHLFFLEDGIWKEKASVASPNPEANGQFGFSISLRGAKLAVGEPGAEEGAGAAHVFALQQQDLWIEEHQHPVTPSGATQFGRSISIDGEWLAVGEVSPHGESAGAVHLFRVTGGGWSSLPQLKGDPEHPEERFGQSISMRGDTLVVGAPGADGAKGMAYVYTRTNATWSLTAPLKDPDAAAGDQFGFSVATNGQDVVVGAPTAGTGNDGAAWVWRSGDGLAKLPGSAGAGEQLGYSVAIDGNRIALGTPAPFEGLFGSVHSFTQTAGVWSESDLLEAENADPVDLSGLSVAMSGGWLIFGTVLGDQGGDAAGSVAAFLCEPGKECKSKGEVAVSETAAQEVFGTSLAADGDLIAVGARRRDNTSGSVTVFRRATKGWRQKALLTRPGDIFDRFGAKVVVAVHRDTTDGDLLIVGDPLGDPPSGASGDPAQPLLGTVYLLRRKEESWKLEATLLPPVRQSEDKFGRSVATDGKTVVVGALQGSSGVSSGAAYAFEKQEGDTWSEGIPLDGASEPGDEFGFAVAVFEGATAVGAPFANGNNGKVYIFQDEGHRTLITALPGGFHDELGFSVALGQDTLVAGGPGHGADSGAIYIFERSPSGWKSLPGVQSTGAGNRFGFAVSLSNNDFVVGAPGPGPKPEKEDLDHTFLFQRTVNKWVLSATVDAIEPPDFDAFGASVALGKDFYVVTSPGMAAAGLGNPPPLPQAKPRDDRVTVIELRRVQPEISE